MSALLKYVYTFDYQLNGDDGVIGWGNIRISYPEKMSHKDLEDARLEILNRAKRDYQTNPRNRMWRNECPITSVLILNIWESIN